MNIRCSRCGEHTPRLSATQTRCPRCEREVAAIVSAYERRRNRFAFTKDTTGAVAL